MAKRETNSQMVARMARYLGCSGTHTGPNGELMPCSSREELLRISEGAEPPKKRRKKTATEQRKRRKRRGDGYEPLGERGVLSIDTLPGGGLVSGKELYLSDEEKSGIYTEPKLRERLKRRIMAGSRGGKPGQWSARKAQLLAIEYRRAGGGYRGGKKKPQRSLDKWTDEEWTTSDGKPAIRESGTTRYLPKEAWEKLTPAQRAATNRKKRNRSRTGAQFVPNTERAREAGRSVREGKSECFDESLYIKDVLAYHFGVDEKVLNRSLGKRVGRGAKKIRRVAFDRNAVDADGDGVVQEGTDKERRVDSSAGSGTRRRVGRDRSRRNVDDSMIVASFGQPKAKKKNKRKVRVSPQTIAENEAQRAALRQVLTDTEAPRRKPAIVKNLEMRSQRVAENFGEVETKEQANAALGKAFPNASFRISLDDNLSVGQRSAVHTLLDLASQYPDAARNLSSLDHIDRSHERYNVLAGQNAAGVHFFSPVKENIDGHPQVQKLVGWKHSLGFKNNFDEMLRPDFINAIKRPGAKAYFSTEYIFQRSDAENATEDELKDMATATLIAHEFGHLVHFNSMRSQYLDGKTFEEQLPFIANLPSEKASDFIDEIVEDIKPEMSNVPDEDLREVAAMILFRDAFNKGEQQGENFKTENLLTHLRDGLSLSQYLSLTQDGKRVSTYGGSIPDEAIAEVFAAKYMLEDIHNVNKQANSEAIKKIFQEIMKVKTEISEMSSFWENYKVPEDPMKIDFDSSELTSVTCPGFHFDAQLLDEE